MAEVLLLLMVVGVMALSMAGGVYFVKILKTNNIY